MVYAKDNNNLTDHSKSSRIIGKKTLDSSNRASLEGSLNNTKLSTKITNDKTKRPMELSSLSPAVPDSVKNRSLTTKTKKKDFFITQELLNPMILNNSVSLSRMDTINETKIPTSPNNESTLQSMSLLNRSKVYRDNVKEISYSVSEKKLMNMVQNASELTANLSVLKFNESVHTYTNRQVEELESKVAQIHKECDEITYRKYPTINII